MARLRLDTPAGRLDCEGLDQATCRAAVEPVLRAAAEAHRTGRELELAGRAVWFKGSRLRGWASLRHTARARLLGRPVPRLREARNLTWLRERLFLAPAPLVAGSLSAGGRLSYQFLVTERLDGARPLDEQQREAGPTERAQHVAELAREVARLHALHFVHHDLYLRNLLVAPPPAVGGDDRRLHFIDAWAGGPSSPSGGQAYDLACAMLEGAGVWNEAEQRLLFETYSRERALQDSPVDPATLLAAVDRRRRALLAQIARQPGRWRSPEPPVADWNWRALQS